MTAKEKAKELIGKFKAHVVQMDFFGDDIKEEKVKECALMLVDEILKQIQAYRILVQERFESTNKDHVEYWQEVKEEINNL